MRNLHQIALMGIVCVSLGTFCFASEDANRIEVGTRALSETEQMAIKKDRSQREQQQKSQDNSEEQDNDQARVNQTITVQKVAEESSEEGQEQLIEKSAPVAKSDSYVTSHEGAIHRPIGHSILGDTIELEDGSIWSVRSGDRYKIFNWLGSDSILILPNHKWFSSYDYALVNQNTGETIQVNLTFGPIYNGVYTHWIVAIDYYNRKICLEDGSIWNISYFDEGMLNNWLVNDTIIIGINDGWFASSRPNILINVNMNNYITGKCIY